MTKYKGPTPAEKQGSVCTKVSVPAYLDVHPLHDYEPIGREGTSWIGCYRQRSSRQLAVVHRLRQTSLADFRRLAQLSHRNVARPIALYLLANEVHIAHEYVELDVLELAPLSLSEAASVMFQIIEALYYIHWKKVGCRISTVRVTVHGLVKLVLDWDFEAIVDDIVLQANMEYLAEYSERLFGSLYPFDCSCHKDVSAFVEALRSGHVPPPNHPFLGRFKGPDAPQRPLSVCSGAQIGHALTATLIDMGW